jgi:hypothetical protein
MGVCLISAPEPFDFRLVDPRTGATTLLSLTAINGVATATTRSGDCSAIVKVLLAPDAVNFIESLTAETYPQYAQILPHLVLVAARVRGTYQGLYPLRRFTTGMEALRRRPI